jgi:hypothetical protein
MGKRKIFSMLVMVALVVSMFTNAFIFLPLVMVSKANPGDVSDSYYNETTLNVTVLEAEPRINWYDLQNSTGASMLNTQLDVNQQYTFLVNISSDQGWADIEYIWIDAWADLGSETSYYNETTGGNINLNITYDNSSETASVFMASPTNGSEVTFNHWSETNVTGSDPQGSSVYTHTYNLSFTFTPSYQWRYAPGDAGGWDTAAGYNDTWSWNFNITVIDDDGYKSYNNPTVGETIDEFGVYSYTEIVSAGWPVIVGNPGTTSSVIDPDGSGNITIETRSNGNYSLAVNVTNLTHLQNSNWYIQNTSIQTRGGDLSTLTNFNGDNPRYYYNGSGAGYNSAETDDTSLTTNDVEWAVQIPAAQQAGDYEAQIFYHLRTET